MWLVDKDDAIKLVAILGTLDDMLPRLEGKGIHVSARSAHRHLTETREHLVKALARLTPDTLEQELLPMLDGRIDVVIRGSGAD